jgi:hypothetical protein
LVEVLGQTLLGGGPPDEDPIPDDGVDPHPLTGQAIPDPFVPQHHRTMQRMIKMMVGVTRLWAIIMQMPNTKINPCRML